MATSPVVLDAHSIASIDAVAASMGFTSVLCFESPSPLLADVAHAALADRLLAPAHRTIDMKSFSPEGERWKVAELEPALAALTLAPMERHVVGLWEVHRMDRACFDKLLKACEEPSSKTTVCWSAPTAEELPPTLRSRISTVVRLDHDRPPDLARRLNEIGLNQALLNHPALSDMLVAITNSSVNTEVGRRCAPSDTPAQAAHELLACAVPLATELNMSTTGAPLRRLQARLARLAHAHITAELHDSICAGNAPDHRLIDALNLTDAALTLGAAPAPQLTHLFTIQTLAR